MTCQDILKPSLYERNQMFWTKFGNDFQLFVPIKTSGQLLWQNPDTPKLDVVLTLTEWIIRLNLTNSGHITSVNGWR